MSLLLIFIDGVGIGTRGAHNPLDGAHAQVLNFFQGEPYHCPFDGVTAITDVHLGVAGKPQSATGQTAILTGVNAPALIGHHLSGFPSGSLKQTIQEQSILKRLVDRNRRVVFANAYAPRFVLKRPRSDSVSTIATEAAGLPLRTVADLRARRAVYHDFTHCLLKGLGVPIAYRSPEEAGQILAELAEEHDFCFYEYFMTDFAGHSRDYRFAQHTIRKLDQFLLAVLDHLDLSRHTVILTSDHGNIEDITIKSHTDNKVATIVWGAQATELAAGIASLCDIAPAIVEAVS